MLVQSKAIATLVVSAVFLFSTLSAERADAEPDALGFQVQPLADFTRPRGIDSLDGDIVVLTVTGELSRVDSLGITAWTDNLDHGTWIGPAVHPIDGTIYASNIARNNLNIVAITGTTVNEIFSVSTIASIYSPAGLVVSEDGSTLFVSSYRRHRVYAIDLATNTVSDCAPAHYPDGLEVWNGNLYVANRGNNTILKVQLDAEAVCGEVSEFASDGIANPIGLMADGDELLVANYGDGSVRRIGLDRQVSNLAAGFRGPVGLAKDATDALVVAEYDGHRLWRLTERHITGLISGLAAPITIICRNLTSRQEEQIYLVVPGEEVYDCTEAGLITGDGDLIEVSIRGHTSGPPPSFALEFTQVPPYGSHENLYGRADVDNPELYAVATYIKVGAGWWTKPYWARPKADLADDGSFVVDITTGGQDQNATEIAAFVIPRGYGPPSMGGGPWLPAQLDVAGKAMATATRTP